MLFAPFFAAYFLLRADNQPWPPEGVELDVLRAFGASPLVLVASSFTIVGIRPGRRAARRGARMRLWLLVTIGLGALFLANQLLEYADARLRRRRPPVREHLLAAHRAPRRPRHRRARAMALLFVRAVRSRRARRGLVGRRGVAVLAPRRRDLGVRVLDDLAHPVKVLPGSAGGRRGDRRVGVVRRRRRRVGRAQPANRSWRGAVPRAVRSCHGADGTGVEDRGPTLTDEGRAAVDFVLRTGPHADAGAGHGGRGAARPATPRTEIVALVDYAGAFGDGPDIPTSTSDAGDLAAAASCTSSTARRATWRPGSGAAIGGGREAPDLMESTPTEIGEAILVGPGAMPVFGTFSDQDIDDVAAYIRHLQGARRRRRRLRRRRPGRRGPRRLAARAAAAHRPDPLDRHAPRGP